MREPQMLDERLLCASSAGVSSWPRIWLDLRAGRSRRDAGAAEAFSDPLRRRPGVAAVVAAGPAGSRGWGRFFSAASRRILNSGRAALKAGSRALPVAALRPRPKYVLFDRYAGAHRCLAASEHRLSSERRRAASPVTLVCRHARPCHSLLAARAAAMATAEQWRSLCRQAMPVLEACAQCVCPSWRWRCTMQRFKLSVETPSAGAVVFVPPHVRFPGVGDVSKKRSEALEQFGAAWYGTAPGGPLRPRRSKTK